MRMGQNPQGTGSTGQFLPVTDMVEVAEVIQGAYEHVLANLVGDYKAHAASFVAGFILQEKPYLLVTPAGLERAIDAVFGNAKVTDFVLTLQYTFGSRWGMSGDRYHSLCANLAAGATPVTGLPDSSIPNALAERLAGSQETAFNLLVANPWLVVLMLLQLFISVAPQKA